MGLSPRVRGNRSPAQGSSATPGSIPACTGEPAQEEGRQGQIGVYPRVYGGTYVGNLQVGLDRGLSPRVRGNPHRLPSTVGGHGSIPACTGEPTAWSALSQIHAVYPRVYGGTDFTAGPFPATWGLSPRVRGNRTGRTKSPYRARSIPACTGEPDWSCCG